VLLFTSFDKKKNTLQDIFSCCDNVPANIFDFPAKDKTCGGTANDQAFFNKFLINKLQKMPQNNTMALQTADAKSLFKTSAVIIFNL